MSKELVVMGDKYLVDSCDGTVRSITVQTTTYSYHQGLQTLQIGNVVYVTPAHFVPYRQKTVYSLTVNADDGRHLLFPFFTDLPLKPGDRISIGWGAQNGKKVSRPVYIIRHNPVHLITVSNFVEVPVIVLKFLFKNPIGIVLLCLIAYQFYKWCSLLGGYEQDTELELFIFMLLEVVVIAIFSFVQYVRNLKAVAKFNAEVLRGVKARLGLA